MNRDYRGVDPGDREVIMAVGVVRSRRPLVWTRPRWLFTIRGERAEFCGYRGIIAPAFSGKVRCGLGRRLEGILINY
jgi:hypothetical protein